MQGIADMIGEIRRLQDENRSLKKELAKNVEVKSKQCKHELLKKTGWDYQCPMCDYAIGINQNMFGYSEEERYCPNCGQKLDWD